MSEEIKTEVMKSHRARVLLLVYACSPYRGGEPGVGWNRAIETAKYFDTWVLCKKQRYEDDIKKYFVDNGEIPGLCFYFIPRTRFEKFLKKILRMWYTAYNLWHRRAYRYAVKLHKKLEFDLVHQVTFCGFREPGYLWKLEAPFIWGPVGGTQNYPWRFLICAGITGAVKEGIRTIFNRLQFRLSLRVRKVGRKAVVVLTANSEGKWDFERVHKIKPVLDLDVGSTTTGSINSLKTEANRPLRILWIGVFEHRKALHLLIMALSKVPSSLAYELRILGDGPLKKRWQKLAQRFGIESHFKWMGWLPHKEALAQYDWADVFVFTSLRDTCGTVVLEALSHGVPVICLDHQGVGDVVTIDCGIKIPVTTPGEVILRLRDVIGALAGDKTKLEAFGRKATERAREYLWCRKGEQMAAIYDEVLTSKNSRNIEIGEIRSDVYRSG